MNHALIFNVHVLGIRRPSGAHRIASFLREHDWDVEVIDYARNFTYHELEEVARMRITSKTVFVGFSSFFSYWEPKFDQFIDWLKKEWPHLKIIVGGQSRPRIESKQVDYYIHGYGEYAVLELVKNLVGNSTNNIILDPLYLGDKKVISANKFYPSFPMKSLRIKYEDRDHLQPWEWLTMEFSRGCKFKCAYCNFPILGVKGDYSRDAEDFELELKDTYDRFGISHYYVADETFNDRTEKIEKFANVVSKTNIKPIFSGFIRADLLVSRRQDWDLLAQLGFFGHFYGVETFNHETGKAVGKGMDPKKLQQGLLEAKNWFKERGPYRGSIGIVIGLPYETVETQLSTFKWLEDNWQGECAHFWPLEIPIDPKKDVLSTMSERWDQFGYRVGNQAPPPPPPEFQWKTVNGGRINHGISNIYWENDHMTYAKACELSNQQYVRILKRELNYGISMFNYGDFMLGGKDIYEVLKLNGIDISPDMDTAPHEKAYVQKKLNR